MSDQECGIVIIGGGILGCATALELGRRGVPSVVVDRLGEVGHGTTAASCGLVRRFYSTETMIAVAEEGARIFDDWRAYLAASEEEDVARFVRCGILFIPSAVDDGIRETIERMKGHGVDVAHLSRDEVAGRYPFLEVRSQSPVKTPGDDDFFEDTGRDIDGAIHERDAGYVVTPLLATSNLRAAAERAGATFRLGRGVASIEKGGGPRRFRLVLEDGATLDADVVVNAAGPHSTMVNEMAGVSLPLEVRPLRREVGVVANPRFVEGEDTDVPVLLDIDSGTFCFPEPRGNDLDFGSLDPECDEKEWIDDPDAMDVNCSVEGFERNLLRAMKRFPELRFEKRRGIASLYDVTLLDWNPILDRTDEDGWYVAMGTSGSSFKTAPVIGAVMAELIGACEAGHDHDRDPVRMRLPRTGFELDVGFFSRRRGAHASTRSVLG